MLTKKKFLCGLIFLFCIGMPFHNVGLSFANNKTKIVFDVTPSAQISSMEFFLKPWMGADRLHFKITLKNIAPQEKRFKVTIFLDEGPSGAMLYPRNAKKGQKPLISSQKEITQIIPLVFEKLSTSFMVKVEEFE